MGTLVSEEKQQSEAEPNSEQLLSHNSAGIEIQAEEGSWHVDSGSTEEEEPKPKKRRLKIGSHSNSDDDSLTSETLSLCENETDAPQLHDCKEEEVLTVQQLCNQERNSSLDQEEQDAAHVKEEELLCSSQEEEDFGLKQETDTFMVTPTDEANDKSETEANIEQLLSHHSADTKSQDQGAGKNVKPGSSKHEEPKKRKRFHRNRSDLNNVDKSSMSENQCDTDTGEKSVKCCDNDKDCKNESQKKKNHTKSHVCNTCGKRFRQKHHLSCHERIHTGEKPFSCDTCGQRFNVRSTFKIHMRIHTGEKPFSCKTCGQSFIRLDNLKTHMRIHTGEKPFSCETCGQRFIVRSTLKRHMRIHTGEKLFSCKTCGQSFNVQSNLKTHMRIHTDSLSQESWELETLAESNSGVDRSALAEVDILDLEDECAEVEDEYSWSPSSAVAVLKVSKLEATCYDYGGNPFDIVGSLMLSAKYTSAAMCGVEFMVSAKGPNLMGCDLFYGLGFSIACSVGEELSCCGLWDRPFLLGDDSKVWDLDWPGTSEDGLDQRYGVPSQGSYGARVRVTLDKGTKWHGRTPAVTS
ncbi:uncharacterized protein KZ484_011986 [Pholidichthys leucotaenia]